MKVTYNKDKRVLHIDLNSRYEVEYEYYELPELVLTIAGLYLGISLLVFCAMNWGRTSEQVNWWSFLPAGIGMFVVVATLAYMLLTGLYYIGKHWR